MFFITDLTVDTWTQLGRVPEQKSLNTHTQLICYWSRLIDWLFCLSLQVFLIDKNFFFFQNKNSRFKMKIQIFSDTDQMKLMSQSIPTSIIPPSLNIKLIKFCFLAIFCCLAGIAYTVCIIKVDVKKLGNKCLEMDRQYRHKLNHTLNELEKFRNHSKIDSKEPTYDDLLQYYRAKHNRPTLTDASCTMDDQSRYDCDPSPNSSKQQCLLLGCCWKQPNHKGKQQRKNLISTICFKVCIWKNSLKNFFWFHSQFLLTIRFLTIRTYL